MSKMDSFAEELISLMEKYDISLELNARCAKLWMGQKDGCKFKETYFELDEDGVTKLRRFTGHSLSMAQLYMDMKN